MNDDDYFRRQMEEMGIAPIGEEACVTAEQPGTPAPFAAPAEPDGDDDLFLEAMGVLRTTPDKDRPVVVPRARPAPRKEKPAKSRMPEVEDQLDLHGLTVGEAHRQLSNFVTRAAGDGLKVVLVITGKGHGSAGGVSVLRIAVEEWLRRQGRPYVRSYSQAPRSLGGRGAFILHLLVGGAGPPRR